MKLKIDYLDNIIEIKNSIVNAIEIENKKYFYRVINDFNMLINMQQIDNITFLDDDNNEMNMKSKIKLFVDFFNLGFDSKKCINDLSKYINDNIQEEAKLLLTKQYNKIKTIYKKLLNEIDISLSLDEDLNIENLIKILDVKINQKENLLDNLFLLIDLEKLFNKENIIIFVNLKQYLSREEIVELYKYSIYNQVQLLLIDSQAYGVTLENEKKLIVDENLDEFML